ncbi:MAG: hypothetical protein ACREK2_09845 [Gemmatimonadota bacterium]
MRNGSRWGWVVAGMIALAATPALAQDQEQGPRDHAGEVGHRHDPEKRIERLKQSLDLTDAQVTEVRAILAEQAEKGRALKESEDHRGLRALHRETHDRLASVLDETQRTKLEELRKRVGERHREHDGEGGHGEHDGAES